MTGSFHGGQFWEAIGVDLSCPKRVANIVPADVLDAWFDPAPAVIDALHQDLPFLMRTSPPIDSSGLLHAIAESRKIPPPCILAGAGSSDLLFACLPQLIQRGQTAMVLDPSYGEYAHLLKNVIGANIKRFPLSRGERFKVNTSDLLSFVQAENVALSAIVNPNNPTGQYWPAIEIRNFLAHISREMLVLIDETYIDYVSHGESLEAECLRYPNVLIIKSLSKAYALSGIRLGYMVANSEICRALSGHIPPWAVSLPAQLAGIKALQQHYYYRQRWSETRDLRREFINDLQQVSSVRVYPGCANFVLVELESSAQRAVALMQKQGVYVRNCDSMSEQLNDRFLRLAVRTRQENKRVCNALQDALR